MWETRYLYVNNTNARPNGSIGRLPTRGRGGEEDGAGERVKSSMVMVLGVRGG